MVQDIAAGLKAFSGDFQPEAVATSVGKLLTSIGTAFSDLYETNPFMSSQLEDFSSFIVTLGDVAEKGQLDKAADGISKIADSINKIDIDKAIGFGNLFNSASALSDDKSAYRALAKAVEDIRDMMSEPAAGGDSVMDKIFKKSATDKGGAKSGTTGGNAALSNAIRKLSGKIDGLPMAITTGIASSNIVVKLKQ
mgnify:FL=1